jgi:hypothetical protein
MLITRLQEQIELDLETAHGQVAAGYVDPAVSEDTKLIAAAIAQAGAHIALALSSRDEST